MAGFIVIDKTWTAVEQKPLDTFEKASELARRAAEKQRNGPYMIVQIVAHVKLVPESVDIIPVTEKGVKA